MPATTGPQEPGAGRHQVVILVCGTNFATKSVDVLAASSSSGAPTISIGNDSAQALASLLDERFKVSVTLTGGNPCVTEFVLVRQGSN
jgi:hypothetical protein